MAESSQVTVRLTTRLAPEYRIPDAQMAVPADVTRYGLSTIINHLLNLDGPKVFDIILDGELLRQTLGDALLARSMSTESTIQLEYTLLATPPKLATTSPQQDWIRALAAVPEGLLCCGTAAGDVSAHAPSGEQTGAVATGGHPGGVTALCALPGGPRLVGPLEGPLAISGGHDAVARVWRLRPEGPAAVLRLECHTDTVSAVAATDAAVATGAWDCSVRLWQWHRLAAAAAEAGSGEGGPAEKRARTAAAPVATESAVTECAAVLGDHSQAVTGLSWAGRHHLYSSSLDHSLKRWDVDAGVAVDTMATGKALLCCAAGCEEAGRAAVVVGGGADGTLRWWDCRSASRSTEALALRVWKSHSSPVASVSWRPQSDFHVASVAHDGLLRLWDMRSPVPLVTFDDCSGSKLLAAAWGWRDGGMAVATGGEDSKLRVYDAPGPGGLIKEPDAA